MNEHEEPLSHVDAAWLRMDSPTNAMVINAALIFEGAVPYEDIARVIDQRLLQHARFRERVVDPGYPLRSPRWRRDASFDLRLHLHHLRLPAPSDRQAFETLLGDLASMPLPHDRPLWQAYVIDDVEGGTALFVRIHHAIGDGISLMRLLLSLCDDAVPPPPRVGLRHGKPAGTLKRGKLAAEQASTLMRLLLLRADAPSPLKGPLGLRKRVAWSSPLALSDVRRIAKAVDGTVNDVLQSCVAGALHRYLSLRGELPAERDLRSMVTVFLPGKDHGLGNHFSLVFLDLPVAYADARARLRLVKERMDKLKRAEDATVAFAVLDAVGIASPALEQVALDVFTRKATLVTTNVPGPPEPEHLAGHKLRTVLVWAPMASHLGLGFTMVSYAEQLHVGVLADARRLESPAALVSAFESEFAELLRSAQDDA